MRTCARDPAAQLRRVAEVVELSFDFTSAEMSCPSSSPRTHRIQINGCATRRQCDPCCHGLVRWLMCSGTSR